MDYQILEMAARTGMDSLLAELDGSDKELVRIIKVACAFDDYNDDALLESTIQENEEMINGTIAMAVENLARRMMQSKGKPEKVAKAIKKWKFELESDIENTQNFRPLLNCLENING